MTTAVNGCKCKNMTEEEKIEFLNTIIKDYNYDEKNLMQILHVVQTIFGYIHLDVQRHIAKEMNIPLSRVSGVVTFYSFFSSKPKGEYIISVCLGTACYVRGGKKIIDKLKDILNLEIGETTDDKKFTLQIMRCIGACGLAPVITINDKVYKQVNPNKLQKIIGTYQ